MKYLRAHGRGAYLWGCVTITAGFLLAHDFVNARFAAPPLKVLTTATDYANIAELIGGEHVKATSLTNGAENMYRVVATPAKMLDLRDADLFLYSGLDLETWLGPVWWAPDIVKHSGNPRIQEGQPGNVDCSKNIKIKEPPVGIKPPPGHTHLFGNP